MGLGVPESVLVEYQVRPSPINAFQVSSWKGLLFQMINRLNQILNLQDAFASFDKGGNGMVPTKVHLHL